MQNNEEYLILRSYSCYSDIINYNHFSGRYYKHVSNPVDENKKLRIHGFYDFLNENFITIYAKSKALSLRVDNIDFSFNKGLKVEINKSNSDRILTVNMENTQKSIIQYSVNQSDQYVNDLTPFVDLEDFDFGLFIANIAINKYRQNILINEWS